MKRLIIIAMLLSSGTAVEANWIIGQGLSSCVTWTEARKTPFTEYSTKAGLRAAKEAWLGGYLSSQNDLSWFYNTGAPLPDFLKGKDWDVLTAWIDNYCQAHPMDNLDKAAQQLFFELIGGAFANPPKSK